MGGHTEKAIRTLIERTAFRKPPLERLSLAPESTKSKLQAPRRLKSKIEAKEAH